MSKCDFYKYDRGDCCIIKSKIKGQDNDKISNVIYQDFCSYSEGFKKCPFYDEFKSGLGR